MKKFLVTGGAGFIGSAVVRALLKRKDVHVVNVDALTYAGNLESIPEQLQAADNYQFEHINLVDQKAVENVLEQHRPDVVMHLAAESHVDRSIDGPSQFIQTNVVGTYNLLQASLNYWRDSSSGQFKFHHVSTDEVYGDLTDTGELFTESTAYDPSSPYSATKAASDHLVRAWGRTYGLPVLVTNCSNNYGPYHFPEKLIPHMILNALKGKQLPVYGDGSQIRDWLYVEDHAEALIQVAEKGVVGETYNIGGHNEKKNIDVVARICELLDEMVAEKPKGIKSFSDLITFVKDRPGHDVRYAIDASKIERELGWKPKETFESGIRKTVAWYLNNEKWWQRVLDGSYKLSRIGDAK